MKTQQGIILTLILSPDSQIKAVYDMTIGYPKTLPHSETDILHGKIPEEVQFHIKR
jgi:lysocardiolipin and lysophospholipid acyltransferase